jgi:formate dehydrogenase alpha subunit
MTNSMQDIVTESQCLFIIGSNTTEAHPVMGARLRKAKRQRGVKLIVADPRRIDLADIADIHLRQRPGTDIALLNGLMHVIIRDGRHDEAFIAERTEGFEDLKEVVERYTPAVTSEITGVPAADIERAALLMAENRPGALLYCLGITQHAVGVANVMSCANLQMLLGNLGVPGGGVNPLRGQNNVQGACDVGSLPNVYPGYQQVTDAQAQAKFEAAWGVSLPNQVGLTLTEMIKAGEVGDVRCLYMIGEDPMTSDPDLNRVRQALERTEFIVVQELFMTETARCADVVLPAASFAEKEGTFTNTERRVQRLHKAVDPPGQAQLDSWIVTELARRLIDGGVCQPDRAAPLAGWEYEDAGAIMHEINQVSPIYTGISYRRLDAGAALQWPAPTTDHPGTPILHVGRFVRGLGRFMALDHVPPAEMPDEDYPLVLTSGRILYHWHGGAMTHHARGLEAVSPEGVIELNPMDARRAGVSDGQKVRVASRRGEIVVTAQVTGRIEPGLLFGTFHFMDANINFLTNSALDPGAKIPEYKVCAVRLEAVAESPVEDGVDRPAVLSMTRGGVMSKE